MRLLLKATIVAAALVLGGCSSSAAPPAVGTSGVGGASPVAGGSPTAGVASTSGGGGANSGAIDACSLVTGSEIDAAYQDTAATHGTGKPGKTVIAGASACSWTGANGFAEPFGITVVLIASSNDFDAGYAKQPHVSGIGDAAYWIDSINWLVIKTGTWVVTIEDTGYGQSVALQLAKLILPRIH
ncbi:MAG: hypothetical protein ABSD62_14460 [Candidatus Limnocylindrales bacterium]|jgi:hypothetical protein